MFELGFLPDHFKILQLISNFLSKKFVTKIVTTGRLKKGDFFVSCLKWGKVRDIINY